MRFSVVIPVYNAEKYLFRCLKSVLSYRGELEVIAVDDGSTDGSNALLRSYPDRRLRVIRQEKGGVMRAWKRGVQEARGDYIVFVDADDYVSEELFPSLERVLEEGEFDLVQFGWSVFDDRRRADFPDPLSSTPRSFEGEALKALIEEQALCFGSVRYLAFPPMRWGKAFRTALLKELLPALGTDVSQYDDVCLCVPFLMRTDTMYYLPKSLYHYYKRAGSLSHAKETMEACDRDSQRLLCFFEENAEAFGLSEATLDQYYFCFRSDVYGKAVLAKDRTRIKIFEKDERLQQLMRRNGGKKNFLLKRRLYFLYRILTKLAGAVRIKF